VIRICYIIPSLRIGGTERQLLYLVRHLVRDHEITVICTDHDGTLAGDARRLGAYVRVLRLWSGWDPRLRRKLRHCFRLHRPDIVHTFLSGFDYAANRAARETGVPVVISSRRELAAWKKPRHLRLQNAANQLVDAVVANSQAVADFAIRQEGLDAHRVHVIPNGCDADDFVSRLDARQIRQRFKIPFNTHVIGMVANFSPVKDHALFLDIAQELFRRRPDVHFLLVGAGPLQRDIDRRIRKRNLENAFTHAATIEEIRDLYSIMSASVLCSKVEGFPNAIMESMAAGTPVIAADVGGIPELVRDGVTGKLVDSREPAAFADAIEDCLAHPEQAAHRAQQAARHLREAFSVPAMAARHRALYRDLLVHNTHGA